MYQIIPILLIFLAGFYVVHAFNHNSKGIKTIYPSQSKIYMAEEDFPPPTVWAVFGEIAAKTGAINLGQGFPDWKAPPFVLDALRNTIDTPNHQYTRPAGHPALVKLLASRFSQHLNREINPMDEIAVSVGASQALYLALQVYCKPGDEVVLFEPYFDLYLKQIKLTGAVPKYVPLGGKAATLADPWALDIDALEKSISDKTKILILNTPHNPTGKVFSLKEQQAIAEIVKKYPKIIVLVDEVYKFTVYNPFESGDPTTIGHHHFARLPGMWDRSITLSSCGKTFSVTGWQVGYLVGPKKLIRPIQDLLPCVQFCPSTTMQQALSNVLEVAYQPYEGHSSYYEWFRSKFSNKRKILEEGLSAAGIEALPSHGGFFVMARLPKHDVSSYSEFINEPYDWKLCRKIASDYGVIGIPASSFFSPGYEKTYGPLARFAFCKLDETLIEANLRFKKIN